MAPVAMCICMLREHLYLESPVKSSHEIKNLHRYLPTYKFPTPPSTPPHSWLLKIHVLIILVLTAQKTKTTGNPPPPPAGGPNEKKKKTKTPRAREQKKKTIKER
uniref:Uncharacterized protein n=1 Tax=Cacopsylla melanoneura TaxID=428564 RepID=A0A8D8ZBM4_9HEMI